MTAIISWLNKESGCPYIWTTGDTKINNNDKDTLTLEGAKIFKLPTECKDLSTINNSIYFSPSTGYSFAGSSLAGLNACCYL